MKTLALIAATALLMSTGGAFADKEITCTEAPRGEWKSVEEIQKMIEAEGYAVTKVKTEDQCYEVYASKDSKKFELYVDGTNGKIVEVDED